MTHQALPTPSDLGTVRDVFGLLTHDKKQARPENIRKFLGADTPVASVARLMAVSRTAAYKDEVPLSEEVKAKVVYVAACADLAAEIFKSMEKAREWMLYPNTYFFGLSPFDVCFKGDGQAVLELLMEKLGIAKDGAQKSRKEISPRT